MVNRLVKMEANLFSGLAFVDNNSANDFQSFPLPSNGKSNLADIFDNDSSPQNQDNSSAALKYIPPKANQSHDSSMAKHSSWKTEIAKVVIASKIVNDGTVPQGRVGLAILSHSSDDSHQMILYKSNEQMLSMTLLPKTMTFQTNQHLLNFCDDADVRWNLFFNRIEDSNDVIDHLQRKCCVKIEYKKNAEIETDADKSEMDSSACNKDLMHRMSKIGQPLPVFNKSTANDDIEPSRASRNSQTSFSAPNYSKAAPRATPVAKIHLSGGGGGGGGESSDSVMTISNVAELEARIHNTELRMNLLKLDTKMDRVLDNIERLQISTSKNFVAGDDDKENEIIKLEERVLELKKENRLLKLHANKNESNDNVVDENVSSEMMLKLQQTVAEKDLEMSALKTKIKDLETDLMECKESKCKAVEEIERKMAHELESLGDQIKEKENLLEKASSEIGESKTNNGMVMGIMNQLYQELYRNIDGKFPNSVDLLKLIAKTIRKETEAALNQN